MPIDSILNSHSRSDVSTKSSEVGSGADSSILVVEAEAPALSVREKRVISSSMSDCHLQCLKRKLSIAA